MEKEIKKMKMINKTKQYEERCIQKRRLVFILITLVFILITLVLLVLTIGSPFNGIIDEVLIYNRTLTTTEITDIYNAGKFNHELDSSFTSEGETIYANITMRVAPFINVNYLLKSKIKEVK